MIASLSDACVEMDPAVISIPHRGSESMRVAHAGGIDESIESPEPVVVERSRWVWIEVPMDFELTEEQRMLKDAVARFVAEEISS